MASLGAGKPPLDDGLALRARGRVIVLDAAGREETVYHLPAELSDRSFQFYQMSDRTAVAQVNREDRKNRLSYKDLIWFTKEGTITRRVDGALAGPDLGLSIQAAALIVAFAIPTPLAPIGEAFVSPLDVDDGPMPRTYLGAVWNEIPSIIAALIIAAALTAVAIWLYFRRTARYGEQRRVAWLVLIGLWGLPGYFGYVLRRHWPPRIACESCGIPAPRDREACFHCGEEFPLPASNGLEIYA